MKISFKELDENILKRSNALFPKKNCFIEVLPGNFVLPRKFSDIYEEIRELKVFEDDIWLVSYPRTGSTWAQEMIWLLGHNLDFEAAKQMLQIRAPMIELSALYGEDHEEWVSDAFGNTVETVRNMARPRFARSHLPWHLLPAELETVKPKIIYTARNPKDLCVSFYHYCKLMHNLQGSFEAFVDLFLDGYTPIGPYWQHVLPFWQRSLDSNILFLKYEDMNRDLPAVLRKCARFLDVEQLLTNENMQRICEHLKFDQMQNNTAVNMEPVLAHPENANNNNNGQDNEAKTRFIRKGKIGDWKNHFTSEMSERFDDWIEKNTRGSGLKFDYE